MFLRDEEIKIQTGIRLVTYCKACGSIEIETIQTCKHCGSNDIGHPNILKDNKKGLGEIPMYEKYIAKIYKCDKCGKEFDGLKTDCYISWCDGEFEKFKVSEEHLELDRDAEIYHLNNDLCVECKDKVVQILRRKLLNLTHPSNIEKCVKEFMEGK